MINKSGNEDKPLYENYTDCNIPLENGKNYKEEHNYRESSTFIPSERNQIN
ncbi:46507_t:CDS:2 [Gigaspora margarita]|uniref:46507_t:CDS:1 n=1 Tax=Gigaspora margarita TaxID=4874 RepID=A0ABN7UT49_GIGMA|nr:46507_t:CDS:2 [Gigaspora margarita]